MIVFTLVLHQRPRYACALIGQGYRRDVHRPTAQKPADPSIARPRGPLAPADDRAGAVDEEPTKVAVPSLRYAAKPLFAATGSLLRDEAKPRRELPAGAELVGIDDSCGDRACGDRSDAWDCCKPAAHVVRAMPSEQPRLNGAAHGLPPRAAGRQEPPASRAPAPAVECDCPSGVGEAGRCRAHRDWPRCRTPQSVLGSH